MNILPSDSSYNTFCNLASGYRMFRVIAEAVSSGIIDLLDDGERTPEELLAAAALQPEAGSRFIAALVSVGLLEGYGGKLHLSRFSKAFLSRASPTSQRHTLEFELVLQEKWDGLGQLLLEGQGTLIRAKPPEEYRRRLQLFHKTMGEAATVRSRELWSAVSGLPGQGTIIDIGAGDGTYLREFLGRHPGWRGVACDLPDVCSLAEADDLPKGMSLHPCNILVPRELATLVERYRGSADLLLFSNVLHCYSRSENRTLLRQSGELLAGVGILLVHDFFRDANSLGALYDLHMLVNTYNGRSYSTGETAGMLRDAGFPNHSITELPSGSLALAATRTIPGQAFLGQQ